MNKQPKAEIGTISHGTMRAEDLVPDFLYELERLIGDDKELALQFRALTNEANSLLAFDDEQGERGVEWEDAMTGCLDALFDALNEFAPDYCYFGSNEGDGSDFGFWPSDDALQMAVHDGEILATGDTRRDTPTPTFILHTSDHGNQSLYRVELVPVW